MLWELFLRIGRNQHRNNLRIRSGHFLAAQKVGYLGQHGQHNRSRTRSKRLMLSGVFPDDDDTGGLHIEKTAEERIADRIPATRTMGWRIHGEISPKSLEDRIPVFRSSGPER